jgi:hypothetical protein
MISKHKFLVVRTAGPTVQYVRSDGARIPVAGIMKFDSADVANLQSKGRWTDVIKHEMGHVIGIGTQWKTKKETINGTDSWTYIGSKGVALWKDECKNSDYDSPPVEHDGGPGTRGGHWDELCFNNMLMVRRLSSVLGVILSIDTFDSNRNNSSPLMTLSDWVFTGWYR